MDYIFYIIVLLIVLFFFFWIKYGRYYEKKIKQGEKEIEITVIKLRGCLKKYYEILEKDKKLAESVILYNKVKGKVEIPVKLSSNDTKSGWEDIRITKDGVLINGESQLEKIKYTLMEHNVHIKQVDIDYDEYVIYMRKIMRIHLFFYKIFNRNA